MKQKKYTKIIFLSFKLIQFSPNTTAGQGSLTLKALTLPFFKARVNLKSNFFLKNKFQKKKN